MEKELIEYLPDTCAPVVLPFGIGCLMERLRTPVPNSFGFDIPNDFGLTNATDLYLHVLVDNVSGLEYWFPPGTPGNSVPVICTDVAAIQTWLDSLGFGITYTVNAFNEIVLFFNTPGTESQYEWWMGNDSTNGYTNKTRVTRSPIETDEVTYTELQIVKEKLPDGSYQDRYFVKGANPLAEIGINFDPSQILSFASCVECQNTPTNVPARKRSNFVITGTTPLFIGGNALSIIVTKTSSAGQVLINGDNGIDYPLDAQYEIFTDGVNEEVSTLTSYTITGSTPTTTYKVHLIR